MRSKRGWAVVLVVLVVAAGALAMQARRVAGLRDEVARRKAEAARLDELRRENERLRARVAQPVLLDQGETEMVGKRVAALKRQLALRSTPAAKPPAPMIPPATRLIERAILPSTEWKNAGRATPESALETALWAAAGGDVDTLARGLTFVGERARTAAQVLLESLPSEARGRYQTPERLVAALTIPDVPTGAVEVRRWGPPEGLFTTVEAQFSAPDGTAKVARLLLKSEADGWKFMVGDSVIAKYAAQLKTPPAAATANATP